jgi:phage terminase large subunit-like protein
LEGSVEGNDQFGIIYSIDKDDDWKSDFALQKANPNWGVSVMPETILASRDKALAIASAANNFKTKHLNVWCNANSNWISIQDLHRCADYNLSVDQFEGEQCYIGLDLASRVDIAAMVKLFVRKIDGKTHYYAFGDFWLPRDTVQISPNAQYKGWETTGELHVTEGASINFDEIEETVLEACRRFDVLEVPYDPFQATQLSEHLLMQDVPMIECRATVLNFSDPMKEIEAAIRDRRFHYTGDPVLTWMFSNVVCHTDAKDNIYPRKDRAENKIDGVVALIMTVNRALASDDGFDINAFLETNTFIKF